MSQRLVEQSRYAAGARGVDGSVSIFGGLDRPGLSRFRVYVQLSFFPSPVACSPTFNLNSNRLGP
jgi:hypothetical protein